MTTGGQKAVKWSLDEGDTLKLGKTGRSVDYRGLVLLEDMLIVIDNTEMNVQMYNRHDGKFLGKSDKLESNPLGLCAIGNAEFAVILKNSKLKIMSFHPTGDIKLIKTLDIIGFDKCHAVGKVESVDKVLVIGQNLDGMHYCFVSLKHVQIEPFHQICKRGMASHLAIQNNTVYISCSGGDYNSSDNDCVYAYDIANSHKQKFTYQHKDLKLPWGLALDTRFIFVCSSTNSIHQLTHGGELMTIHRVTSLPVEIFFDEMKGVLYTTTSLRNQVTRYRLKLPPSDPDPTEVPKIIASSSNISVLVVGHKGVGKTSVTNHLLGKDVKLSERHSIEGIDVHKECCIVSSVTGELINKNSEQYHCPIRRVQNQEAAMNNSDEIETSSMKYASLTVYDFEGQNIINSAFLIYLRIHAVYLLVIDFNQLLDLLKDDTEGRKECIVYDQIGIWLNLIHSCEPFNQPGIPPVILVFTHLEKIPKAQHQKVIRDCFKQICYILEDKPTRHHLKNFIAVDNTPFDPQSRALREMIFELASKQPYWKKEIHANWLPLEKVLMELKASGTKVISLSEVEELNQTGSVPVEIAELELYLRFQHEKGNILYFSMEGLRERIVLDPKWLIDALNSLITADMFIFPNYPSLWDKWHEFEEKGKLMHELLDAIWKCKKNTDFHKNKDHLLLLMDKMNILIRPWTYIEGGNEIKEENFFFFPCMLDGKKTPKEVICPKPDHQIASSSALCYVFTQKFMPSHVFQRLLAACVVRWPIVKRLNKNLIFCECCVFQLHDYHELTLHFRDHVIFVRIAKKGIAVKFPSSELCIQVRGFITDMLNKINECLNQKLNFECFIQCAKCNSDTINGLIPVSQLKEKEVQCDFHRIMIESCKLLKPWFENEQKMDTDEQIYSGISDLTAPEQRTVSKLVRQKRRSSDDQAEYASKINRLDKQGKHRSTNSTSVMENIQTEADRKHNKLCLELNGDIVDEPFKNVKQMAQVHLDKKTVKEAKDMIELWSSLEDKGVIAVGKYDKLIQIMKDAGVMKVIDKIKKTAKEIRVLKKNLIPSQEESEIFSLDSQTSDQDSIHSSSGSD